MKGLTCIVIQLVKTDFLLFHEFKSDACQMTDNTWFLIPLKQKEMQ